MTWAGAPATVAGGKWLGSGAAMRGQPGGMSVVARRAADRLDREMGAWPCVPRHIQRSPFMHGSAPAEPAVQRYRRAQKVRQSCGAGLRGQVLL